MRDIKTYADKQERFDIVTINAPITNTERRYIDESIAVSRRITNRPGMVILHFRDEFAGFDPHRELTPDIPVISYSKFPDLPDTSYTKRGQPIHIIIYPQGLFPVVPVPIPPPSTNPLLLPRKRPLIT